MNWYYENACKRYLIAIVIAFGAVKLFGHVDLIDPGMIYENMMREIEQEEIRGEARQHQAQRDREYHEMQQEEIYHRMMSDKLEKDKRDQGFDYYCKKG